ncbi:hypothetical protein [Bradyrhizobium sp. SZCCHNRI2007]|uniref:hypothetical protein n=1 Tax=Bradyrhizobium sp. SZCCHNRI2007 TaxID=3057281 RepID=UPI0028E65A88|nr:hypothetical protein [Bradyrhizobium sp. SZCCHNRI2007]
MKGNTELSELMRKTVEPDWLLLQAATLRFELENEQAASKRYLADRMLKFSVAGLVVNIGLLLLWWPMLLLCIVAVIAALGILGIMMVGSSLCRQYLAEQRQKPASAPF